MDRLMEDELREATFGLGDWLEIEKVDRYIAKPDECIACLRDLQIALKNENSHIVDAVRRKLGEWKVVKGHMVPLFTAYREDATIQNLVLDVMVRLTTRPDVSTSEILEHLRHLQDYKEAFAKKDVFIILMGILMESMSMEEEEAPEGEGAAPAVDREIRFEASWALLRNLICIPDPSPGDAGFTPLRRNMQGEYLKYFHEETFLDVFLLFTETIEQEEDEKKAWSLLDILYHMVTVIDPEAVVSSNRIKKSVLKDLLNKNQVNQRLTTPSSSRHSRFGTTLISRDSVLGAGGSSLSASVGAKSGPTKGSKAYGREFKDRAGTEKKTNMFHNPFFVDLEEGQVRDHNALNAHLKGNHETSKDFSESVLQGLRKFFEELIALPSLSALISKLVRTAGGRSAGKEYDRPRLLNFVAWILEFHRILYKSKAVEAKKNKEAVSVYDVTAVQGGLDLDMIQFVTARLREYGKESAIHASHLVIVVRLLSQQIKTITVVLESEDAEIREVAEVLTQNIVKDDVMNHLAWIMKNFKSSSHDPRILSYTVEIFQNLLRLMTKVAERSGDAVAFAVEQQGSRSAKRTSTTVESEIAKLADARVVDNLFHLLEKYKRHTPTLHSHLVKLLYSVIKAQPTNIVVFFELSYFLRMHRIVNDPYVKDRKTGQQYTEMVNLLRYIMRQFFKCAHTNGCVFVELLFRKMHENAKEALLESHTAEFDAILNNYENEDYKRVLEKLDEGESVEAIRQRQQATNKGDLPWTAAEDETMKTRFWDYCDHPLVQDLIAAELPEDHRRTGRQVKKRLGELGLFDEKAKRDREKREAAASGANEAPPAKRQKVSDEDLFNELFNDDVPDAGEDGTLEEDLTKLLDEAMEYANEKVPDLSAPGDGAFTGVSMDVDVSSKVANVAGESEGTTFESVQGVGEDVNLELELEKMMEDGAVSCAHDSESQRDSSGTSTAGAANQQQYRLEVGTPLRNATVEDSLSQGWSCSPAVPEPSSNLWLEGELADFIGVQQKHPTSQETGVRPSESPPAVKVPASSPAASQTNLLRGSPSPSQGDSMLSQGLEHALEAIMESPMPSSSMLSQGLEHALEAIMESPMPTASSAVGSASANPDLFASQDASQSASLDLEAELSALMETPASQA